MVIHGAAGQQRQHRAPAASSACRRSKPRCAARGRRSQQQVHARVRVLQRRQQQCAGRGRPAPPPARVSMAPSSGSRRCRPSMASVSMAIATSSAPPATQTSTRCSARLFMCTPQPRRPRAASAAAAIRPSRRCDPGRRSPRRARASSTHTGRPGGSTCTGRTPMSQPAIGLASAPAQHGVARLPDERARAVARIRLEAEQLARAVVAHAARAG